MLRAMSKVYAVIMAGGAGTRFWPASRSLRPKQLLPLAGDSDEPLLAATVRRLAPLVTADRVLVVTGEHLAEATAKAVPEVRRAQILCEPAPRNTAPCIAWAADVIAKMDPEALVMVLPSDHYITNEPEFRNVLERALASAARGNVSTVASSPRARRPATATSKWATRSTTREASGAKKGRAFRREAEPRTRAGVPEGRSSPLERRHVLLPRA